MFISFHLLTLTFDRYASAAYPSICLSVPCLSWTREKSSRKPNMLHRK